MKYITHWTFAFITLFVLTFIGVKDPQIKEVLRLKSFDFLLQSETKEISKDIAVIAIDEKPVAAGNHVGAGTRRIHFCSANNSAVHL